MFLSVAFAPDLEPCGRFRNQLSSTCQLAPALLKSWGLMSAKACRRSAICDQNEAFYAVQGDLKLEPLQPQPQLMQQPPKLAQGRGKKMTKKKKRTPATAACLSGAFSCSDSQLWESLPDQWTRLNRLGQCRRVSGFAVNEHCRFDRRGHCRRVSVLSASPAVRAVRLAPRCHCLRLSWASL